MRNYLRALRWSAWLGWQIESNWTDPYVFAVYVLAKPVTGSLLLVCMYWAVQSAKADGVPSEFLPFLYVSNTCYLLVGAVTFGMSWAVITDREHYGMLKYLYISPARLQSYLIGRGLARALEGLLGALVTLGVGLLAFAELREALSRHAIAWGWLVIYMVLGLTMLVALGLILAGAVLNTVRHGMFLSEGVAGMLYLLSGAVFPINILPSWLQAVSLSLPPTYWLEGMRRSLLGPPVQLQTSLSSWDHPQLVLALAISTLALMVLAYCSFRWSERRAWRLGKIDEATGA